MRARLLRSPQLVGIAAIAVTALAFVVIVTGLFRVPFEPSDHTVRADFTNASQLQKGSQVRVDGKVYGEVEEIAPRPDGHGARVTLAVHDDAGPLYADAQARLRAKTLLAGSFYVELDRGTPGAARLGDAVIPLSRTTTQVEIEDVTSIFEGRAVDGLRTLPSELADALRDPEAPRGTFRALADEGPGLEDAALALRGAEPGEDLPRLVASAARTVRALDAPRDRLKMLVSGVSATLGVTGARDDEIRAALAAGPGVADELLGTLPEVDETLAVTRELVGRLEDPAGDVAPVLGRLRPTLTAVDDLGARAERLVRDTRGALFELGRTGRKARPLVDDLKPALTRVDETIIPFLAREDPVTGKSTTVMIGGTAAGFGGAAGQQDVNGHFMRFPASLGASSVHLPCTSSVIDGDADSLLACQSFNEALETYSKYHPALSALTPTPRGKG